jgi:acetolactate synthase-1/2/3 large subunit
MPEHAVPHEERAEESSTATRSVTTGADAVVAALEAAGVEHAFGVQGGAIMPVYDSLSRSEIRHVVMAHEQGAVHAAAAYATVAGTPGVCLATSGPGATNLVTGLADANVDSDPVVALTGQAPSTLVGKDAFQEADTRGVTEPITKTNYFATDPDTVGDTVGEAVALSRNGRPGPTLVDLPKDVTQDAAEWRPDEPRLPAHVDVPGSADGDRVNAAATALANAERPVVLSGGGVVAGDAWRELRAVATEFGVPVVTTIPGLGSFPEDHDLAMGVAGTCSPGYADVALQHCDALLAVGTRFDDRLTGDVETFAPEAEIVHVDVDPAEVGKNVHADYPLVGDAATVLDQLRTAIPRAPDAAEWRSRCRAWRDGHSMDDMISEGEPLKPQFVVEVADALTPDDTIVTAGGGRHQPWAAQYWTFRHPRTWVSPHGLGTMGYGLPAAVGARLAAADDQSVVCFEGDRSFLATVRELAVAVREDLDVTVIVLGDAATGTSKPWQDAASAGDRATSTPSWAPRFDALAEAFGARGFRLETAEGIEETLRAALAHDGPSVVDTRVEPEADARRTVPSGDDAGFAVDGSQPADP